MSKGYIEQGYDGVFFPVKTIKNYTKKQMFNNETYKNGVNKIADGIDFIPRKLAQGLNKVVEVPYHLYKRFYPNILPELEHKTNNGSSGTKQNPKSKTRKRPGSKKKFVYLKNKRKKVIQLFKQMKNKGNIKAPPLHEHIGKSKSLGRNSSNTNSLNISINSESGYSPNSENDSSVSSNLLSQYYKNAVKER